MPTSSPTRPTPTPSEASRAEATASARTASGRRVIVIGAGASGLAAARRLLDAGLAVEVIEARDRVGGRVHTTRQWPDLPIDLGASWIHGQTGNPMTELATAAGVRLVSTSYDSSVEIVSPALQRAGLSEPDTSRWERLIEKALTGAESLDADLSVDAAVQRALNGVRMSEAERADLAYHLDSIVSTEWGATPDQVSAWTVEDGSEFAGGDVLVPSGFGMVLERLASGVPVRLNTPATSVRVQGSGVRVGTSAGDLTADAVVITVPLGVLKAGALTIEPGLSDAAKAAVDRLGFGVLSKTFLRFDSVFWPTDVDWIGFVGPRVGRWGQWLSLAKLGLPVLLGFHAGGRAREIEAMTEAAVIADAHAALVDMMGSAARPARGALTSEWSRDPWARGSYSFNAVGSTRADRLALAAPIAGRIFWAGEATEPDYHSTVHGAVLSGRRAADEVIRQLG